MALFEWSSDFETGVREIDDQHRALVDMINALDHARSRGSSGPEAFEIFDRLGDYIRYHFNAEERTLLERGLPEDQLRSHKAQHDQFVHRTGRLAAMKSMRSFVVTDELLQFLVAWLTEHILKRDRHDLAVRAPDAPAIEPANTAEAALRSALAEAQGRFQSLADGIPLLLWSCDERGRIGWFNRTAQEFAARDSILDEKAWLDAVHPDDRERVARDTADVLAHPRLSRRELRVRERLGAYRHLYETLVPRYEGHDRFVGLLGCCVDVTQQRLAIEVLHDARALLEDEVAARTKSLQEANDRAQKESEMQAELLEQVRQARAQVVEAHGDAALRTLASGLAHEVNNPLAIASANAEWLQDALPKLLDPKAAAPASLRSELPKALADMRVGLERIQRIVNALRSYMLGQDASDRCDPSAVAASAVELLRSQMPAGVSVVEDLATVPDARCAAQTLLTVLTHLLVNAGQAVDGTGQITVRTWADEHAIHVAVSDTGKGIAAEVLPHVFDAFFTTRDVGAGLGLGLTVARNLVEKAGGTLLVESTPGLGSTFTISLPIAGARAPARS